MIKFRTIKRQEYKEYDNRYTKDVNIVNDWLSDIIGDNGLFFSFRWYAGRKLTKAQLISRVHKVFNQVFRKLLKSHWFKLWKNHFNFVIVEEIKKGDRHAHVALGLKSDKCTVDDIIKTLIELEPIIKIEVFIKNKGQKVKLTKKHCNNMVVSPIYDVAGVAEYISKEFSVCFNEKMRFVSISNFIFVDEVFPADDYIVKDPKTGKAKKKKH